ncbi:unnamed protein product, partial [Polarella glacialis]
GGSSVAAAPSSSPPPAMSSSNSLMDDMLLLDTDDPIQSVAAPPAQPAGLLAPMQVTTAQVGAMWSSLPSERKVQMQTSVGSCQELMMRLQNSLNVAPVEIIGMEAIAAGRVLPGNEPCFLH